MNPTDDTSRAARALAWLRAWGGTLVVGGALATVAAVAGFISYTHICALTLQLHQSWKTAHLMALAVDGQIVIGSAVLAAAVRWQKLWGLAGVMPGLAESLFANWESGIPHGRVAAVWATVAAQAFAVSTFLFERWLKAHVSARGRAAAAGRLTTEQALAALVASGSRRAVAAVASVEVSQVQKWERFLAATAMEAAAMNGSAGG